MTRTHALIPILLLAATPAFAKPPPDDKVPEALIELRSQLFEAGREQALQQVPRFRALCDAEGYPLVGNMVRKGELFQPSQFCAAVRASKTSS